MIYISSDHGGFELKHELLHWLEQNNKSYEDLGPYELDKDDDYPDFAEKLVLKLIGSTEEDSRGVLFCRGGQGMAIAANRFAGIRASVVWDEREAEMTRLDNDSNVLVLPADRLDSESAKAILDKWLETPFSQEDRHIRRLKQIDETYPNTN